MDDQYTLFDLNSPQKLFDEIILAYEAFSKQPDRRTLLFIIFSLNHLREWIAEADWKEIKQISREQLKQKHKFFKRLHSFKEFRIINDLCNQSKHYVVKTTHQTSVIEGARTGLMRAGDSLGHTYYMVANRDIRDIFLSVINEYNKWFKIDPETLELRSP